MSEFWMGLFLGVLLTFAWIDDKETFTIPLTDIEFQRVESAPNAEVTGADPSNDLLEEGEG